MNKYLSRTINYYSSRVNNAEANVSSMYDQKRLTCISICIPYIHGVQKLTHSEAIQNFTDEPFSTKWRRTGWKKFLNPKDRTDFRRLDNSSFRIDAKMVTMTSVVFDSG